MHITNLNFGSKSRPHCVGGEKTVMCFGLLSSSRGIRVREKWPIPLVAGVALLTCIYDVHMHARMHAQMIKQATRYLRIQ